MFLESHRFRSLRWTVEGTGAAEVEAGSRLRRALQRGRRSEKEKREHENGKNAEGGRGQGEEEYQCFPWVAGGLLAAQVVTR